MSNVLRANHHSFVATHQANVTRSLIHRLEVAKATSNSHLVELLEQEKKQLGLDRSQNDGLREFGAQLKRLGRDLVRAIAGNAEPEVIEFFNGSDHWWYVENPQTGECVYADSEAEARVWIEEHYHGKF